MQITETGFFTQLIQTDGVDQLTAARMQLNTVMDAFNNNIAGTYLYELIDEACNAGDPQSNFGPVQL